MQDAESHEAWCLTMSGTKDIDVLQMRVEPSLLFELPAKMPALEDVTSFQLVVVLEDQCGFTWRAMPRTKERDTIAFCPRLEDCPRHWCSAKTKPNHSYLRALASAATKAQPKIDEVRHGEKATYYLELLGLQLKSISGGLLALEDGEFPAPKRRRRDELEDIEDEAVDMQAIEDEVDEEDPTLDFDALEDALEAEIRGAGMQDNIDNLEEPEEPPACEDEDSKETIANDPAQVNHRWGHLRLRCDTTPRATRSRGSVHALSIGKAKEQVAKRHTSWIMEFRSTTRPPKHYLGFDTGLTRQRTTIDNVHIAG